jgi:hypothetical protein
VRAAEDAITLLEKAWGRYPDFYGRIGWINVGQPADTVVSKCRYWGADYNGELDVPRGVGVPILHQFAASSRGPKPWHFDGVTDDSSRKGSDGIGLGPDMNILLVPFDEAFGPPGGEDVDQATFNAMLQEAAKEGTLKPLVDAIMGTPSEPFWIRCVIGFFDCGLGRQDRRQSPDNPTGIPTPYDHGFDLAKALLAGGGQLDPALVAFAATFEKKQ